MKEGDPFSTSAQGKLNPFLHSANIYSASTVNQALLYSSCFLVCLFLIINEVIFNLNFCALSQRLNLELSHQASQLPSLFDLASRIILVLISFTYAKIQGQTTISFFYYLFVCRISLCSPSWLGTHHPWS